MIRARIPPRWRVASNPVQYAGRPDHVEDLALEQPPTGQQGCRLAEQRLRGYPSRNREVILGLFLMEPQHGRSVMRECARIKLALGLGDIRFRKHGTQF
jgi:hypothetical protein